MVTEQPETELTMVMMGRTHTRKGISGGTRERVRKMQLEIENNIQLSISDSLEAISA